MSSAVIPLCSMAEALTKYEMGGASTATMAASLAIINSRGDRELWSTEAAVMSVSVSRTGFSVLMNPPVISQCYPRVATRTALIVCRRFSAWSKTMLAGDRNTSSVELAGAGEADVTAHQRAHDQQGAAHVEAAVAGERAGELIV